MSKNLTFNDKIGILDPEGKELNPLNDKSYSKEYKRLAAIWSKLPAYEKAKEILNAIDQVQLLFIVSGTGSGKSVIVPKLALHWTGYQGKVGMTLPKRVITLSAATFSAKTLDVELGKQVGYRYKGSPKEMANNNQILYMTDGTLISKFAKDPLLSEFKVIIMDEAHERNTRTDLILLFLKNLLMSGKRPDIKVIVMSATINIEKYQNYFSEISSKVIEISGLPNYPITVHFLEEPTSSYLETGMEIIGRLVQGGTKQDILFFVTTSNEALQLCRQIRQKYPKVYCIEVYADMDKNLKIFAESKDKYLELGNYDQKLVIATNVAESSLTIDGLKYVIDSGYELYSYYDPAVYGGILEKRLISKAQALQRRGRVGRTEPGVTYHLLTKVQFDLLRDYPTPEILRQDITMDLLKIIQITPKQSYQEGVTMLEELMDPPETEFIDSAKRLYDMYQLIDDNGKLSDIGKIISHFSVLGLNRALFLIHAFNLHCAREASIILGMAEALSGKLTNLFYKADTICESGCEKPSANLLMEKMAQKRGDHLTYLRIYQEYKKQSNREAWIRKYGIRLDVLTTADQLSRSYYGKILKLLKPTEAARVSSVDVKKNLIRALKLSHQHLTAKHLEPVAALKKIEGQINKESAVYYHYGRKDLAKKKFIYDELISINSNWEFNMVTLI